MSEDPLGGLIALDRPLDLSVIVPTYNNVRYTVQMFASLARMANGLRYEIIVVDNGSTDETLSFVGSHSPGQLAAHNQGETPPVAVHILHNAIPRALARSWNMGVDAARGRHILVSNNDVIFARGSLHNMIATADNNGQVGVVLPCGPGDIEGKLPKIVAPLDPAAMVRNLVAIEEWGDGFLLATENTCQFLKDPHPPQGGFCFLLTRRARSVVGPFDEDYELTGEDYDYFSRVCRHFKLVRARGAYVEHYEHTTCLFLADEYNERLCRNRFLLTEKREGCAEIFSVIMPVYNRVDSLREAIHSVLRQSFPHWRLYVVDDGSGDWDRISALARDFKGEANRIWFFHRQKNQGPSVVRNYGLTQSRGKYVAFLDSDDIWYPDHLQRHYNAHESGDWAMVYSRPAFAWRYWDEEAGLFIHSPDTHPTIKYFGEYEQARNVRECVIQTSAVSVWGDLARSMRFPVGVDLAEDWEYFKAISDAGGKGRPVLAMPHTTCRYHIARSPHEEEHLMRRGGALVSHDVPAGFSREVVIPYRALPDDETGKTQRPLLGVVIPTKDRVDLLKRALASVGPDMPVCVVDDATADRPPLSRVVSDRPLTSLLRLPKAIGPSAARNRGGAYLPCSWLQFLDDDDILVPMWSSILEKHMSDDIDVLIAPAWVPVDGQLVANDEIFTSQICVRREAFLRLGAFVETCSWGEEREMIDRFAAQGARIKRISEPTVIRPARGGTGDLLAGAQAGAARPNVALVGTRRPGRRGLA